MKEARPTTGKALLALFNILGNVIELNFLDLFAGSGRVGFTALQKGAANVTFVESERKRALEIKNKCKLGADVLCLDVRRALPKLIKEGKNFDIIFADPPYELGWNKELISLFEKYSSILADDGVFIYEHSNQEVPAMLDDTVWQKQDRAYGLSVFSFYKRR